jgi:hypothetical protein
MSSGPARFRTPIEQLWRYLKIAVQRHSPSNPTELEDLQRRMGETTQIQVYQACSVILKAEIAAKDASTKY